MKRYPLRIVPLVVLVGVVVCGISLAAAAGARAGLVAAAASCFSLAQEKRATCYEQTIPELYPRYSVAEILDSIARFQSVDPAFVDCHFLAHRLGEAVVALDRDAWSTEMVVEGTDSLCSFGYIHGLTIAAYDGAVLDDETLERELRRLDDICDDPGMGLVMRRNCYHGLGHMLYFLTGTDIPRAFSLCDRLAAGSAREPEHQRNCYTGVTMKLFFVFFEDEVPDWRALTIETAPAFCESLGASRYVGACKRASWILHADEFADGDGIIDFCNDQPDEEEVQLCFTKVFHGLAWKNVDSPEAMVPLCRRMPGDLETLCLLNAGVELLISGGGTTVLPQAVSLCEAAADARTCLRDLAWYGRFLYRVGPDRDAYCAHFSDDLGNRCASVPYE